jgi:hypothetical protein
LNLKSKKILKKEYDSDKYDYFEENMVVLLKVKESWTIAYIGKIIMFDTDYIELDCSSKYVSDIKRFKLNEIISIEKYND